jgi:hypothetical protein
MQCHYSDEIYESEMGRTCNVCDIRKKFLQNVLGKFKGTRFLCEEYYNGRPHKFSMISWKTEICSEMF